MFRLTIKAQLIALLVISIMALGSIWWADYRFQQKVELMLATQHSLDSLESDLLALSNAQAVFLSSKNIEQIEHFNDAFLDYEENIANLKVHLKDMNIGVEEIAGIADRFQNYNALFTVIAQKQTEIGLDHESGLYGALRKAAHELEQIVKPYPEFMATLLMLRRHEKDFMLRRLEKYPQRFTTTMSDFRGQLFLSDIPNEVLAKAQGSIRRYDTAFEELVQQEREIGYTAVDGLKGDITQQVDALSNEFDIIGYRLEDQINLYRTEATQFTSIISIVASAILGIIIIWLTINISRSFRRAINEATRIGKGDWDKPIRITQKNEIGQLMTALEQMRLELIQRSAQLNADSTVRNVLGDLAQKLQGDKDIQTLCKETVLFLANELNAQVGTLYLADKHHLTFAAGYGIADKKSLCTQYELGEGLIGQAARNKELMVLDNLPDDYLSVSSGTGSTSPKSIVIVPAIWNQHLMGVIELGFINQPADQFRRILIEGQEIIAVAIHAALAQGDIQRMLKESQANAEALEAQKREADKARETLQEQALKLQASEEELQAQQEELRVTNEELEAQAKMLIDRTKELERMAKSA